MLLKNHHCLAIKAYKLYSSETIDESVTSEPRLQVTEFMCSIVEPGISETGTEFCLLASGLHSKQSRIKKNKYLQTFSYTACNDGIFQCICRQLLQHLTILLSPSYPTYFLSTKLYNL